MSPRRSRSLFEPYGSGHRPYLNVGRFTNGQKHFLEYHRDSLATNCTIALPLLAPARISQFNSNTSKTLQISCASAHRSAWWSDNFKSSRNSDAGSTLETFVIASRRVSYAHIQPPLSLENSFAISETTAPTYSSLAPTRRKEVPS